MTNTSTALGPPRSTPAVVTAIGIVVALIVGFVPPAQAAPAGVGAATLEWSFNNTIQNTWSGAVADGGPDVACHFLSAGVSEGAEDTYSSQAGNVTILKRTGADGEGNPVVEQPTFANRCLRPGGGLIDQKVVWSGGAGTVDPVTGETSISFTGTLSINFNNHRSPVHITNPVLTVDADGNGALTATVGGYRGAQGSPERTLLEPVANVVIADLSGVESANEEGFTVTPEFFGVTATVVNNWPTEPATTITVPTQAVIDGKGENNWGSWPETFTDFIYRTGLNSYFHSSNANPTNAADANKAPLPLTVDYGTTPEPAENEQVVVVVVPEAGDGEFVWQIEGTDRVVALGTAANAGDHWAASGSMVPIVVSDTRSGGPTWSISGQVSDFSGGISGSFVGWTPQIISPGAGATEGEAVASGFDSGPGLSTSAVLAAAETGHPTGSAVIGAELILKLPIATEPGSYSTTLTITALS